MLLAGGGVEGKFGLDGAQQPDLSGDLGGQFGEPAVTSSPPTGPAGDAHATLESLRRSSAGAPYMNRRYRLERAASIAVCLPSESDTREFQAGGQQAIEPRKPVHTASKSTRDRVHRMPEDDNS
jgi:hypothetical protein